MDSLWRVTYFTIYHLLFFFLFYQNRAVTLKQQMQWSPELFGGLNTQEMKSMVSLCGCVTEKMGGITRACAIIWVRDITQTVWEREREREKESKIDKYWKKENIVEAALSSWWNTSIVTLSLKRGSNTHVVASWWSRVLDTKLDWHFQMWRILIKREVHRWSPGFSSDWFLLTDWLI